MLSLNYISQILPSLLAGTTMTLKIFCWTLIGALPLGMIFGLGLVSKIKLVKYILNFFVWLMRGLSLIHISEPTRH